MSRFLAIVALFLASLGRIAAADTLQVGPARALTVPSAAAAVAHNGDVIEIDAGEYLGDVATWTQDNLTLRGVGGLAHLRADGNHAGGKGTWVIQGAGTTVEYLEFSEAAVPDHNGAGIRQEGAGLTVRHCYFHDNENGILAGANASSDIVIEYSEFADNGYGDGQTHNMYINQVHSFTLRFSYSHHAVVGHNVKTRAEQSYLLYNRISDEADSTTSDSIDIPNGGRAYVIGNLIQQSDGDNGNILRFGEEGLSNPTSDLYVVNNTFVNDRAGGVFLSIQAGATPAVVRNNIFFGAGTAISGPADPAGNYQGDSPMLADPAGFDYHLLTGSPCINTGVAPGTGAGFDLTPTDQYVHPTGGQPRPVVDGIDVGAYEFGTAPDPVDGGASAVDAGASAVDASTTTDDATAIGADGSSSGSDGEVSGGCCSAAPLRGADGLGGLLLFCAVGVALRRPRRRGCVRAPATRWPKP